MGLALFICNLETILCDLNSRTWKGNPSYGLIIFLKISQQLKVRVKGASDSKLYIPIIIGTLPYRPHFSAKYLPSDAVLSTNTPPLTGLNGTSVYLPTTTQNGDKAPNSPNVGKEPSCVSGDILPVVGSLIVKKKALGSGPSCLKGWITLSLYKSVCRGQCSWFPLILINWIVIYPQWKALSNFWTTGVSYQGNQSHCPLDRVIHILKNWAH